MAFADLMHATGMVEEQLDVTALRRFELDAGDGLKVKVASDPLNLWGAALGHSLWTSAEPLIDFMAQHMNAAALRSCRIIELGAGLGVVGTALALRGATATVTDLPACMELMRFNAALNFKEAELQGPGARLHVRELVWGEPAAELPPGPFNYILASDICYDSDCYPALIRTMTQLAAQHPDTKIVFALPDRNDTRAFFPMLSSAGFAWRVLRRVDVPNAAHAVHVYQIVPPVVHKQPPAEAVAPSEPGQRARPAQTVQGLTAEPSAAAAAAAAMQDRAVSNSDSAEGLRRQPASPEVAPTLLVWDFDWSLVEENSDTWVLERLGATPAFRCLQQDVADWTALMDASLAAAAAECGADEAAVLAAARSVPISPAVVQAVRAAAAIGAEQVIVSDANSVYIPALLHKHRLQGCFSAVHTNPAAFENGALRVRPFHERAHGCASCPRNLCKGQVLEDLLLRHNYRRVVYVGDGRGDYCPCTRLGPGDAILARKAYPGGRSASLLQLLAAQDAWVVPAGGSADQAAASQRQLPDRVALSGGSLFAAPSGRQKSSQCGSTVDEHRDLPTATAADHQPAVGDASEAAAASLSAWPAGSVAAPVHVWSGPEECAALLNDILGCRPSLN